VSTEGRKDNGESNVAVHSAEGFWSSCTHTTPSSVLKSSPSPPSYSIVGNEFEGMANTYLQRNARRPSDNQLPPLIFARADVETAPAVVHEKFQLQTVPHLFFFPANQALSLPARNLDELSVTSGGTAIAEELEDRIGLTLKRVPDVRATVKGAVLFAVLAAVAVYFLMDQWSWTKTLPFRRPLWLCFSYLVFAIATGGMIYCIIRRPPPFGITQQKVKLISTRDTSDMFVFEGLLMGFLQLAAGLAFVLTYFFASRRRQTLLQWIGENCVASFPSRACGLLCLVLISPPVPSPSIIFARY